MDIDWCNNMQKLLLLHTDDCYHCNMFDLWQNQQRQMQHEDQAVVRQRPLLALIGTMMVLGSSDHRPQKILSNTSIMYLVLTSDQPRTAQLHPIC